MRFPFPRLSRLLILRRPRWQRRRIAPWLWASAGGLIVLIVAAGLLAWKLRFSAEAQNKQHNPLMLDAPKIPVQALDFTAVNLSGKSLKLTDFRGSVVILNFWATWCVPCLEEMPALDRLTRAMAERKFKVLAVDLQETPDKVHEFAKTHRFGFDLVLDPAGEISSHYAVTQIPVTYILDQRGTIVWRAIGPRAWDSEAAIGFFQELVLRPPAVRLPAPVTAQAEPAPGAPAAGPGTLALGGARK
jgi:peroxiredoxin